MVNGSLPMVLLRNPRTARRLLLIDAENMEEAVKVAERIPGARKGTVEVRPLVELPNLPKA